MHIHDENVGNFVILVPYVNDILLVCNDINLLIETKQMLLKHSEMKDLGKAIFLLSIEIHCDISLGIHGLS